MKVLGFLRRRRRTPELADDSYEFSDGVFQPDPGDRFVEFEGTIQNGKLTDELIEQGDFVLKDVKGGSYDAAIVSLSGLVPPRRLIEGHVGEFTAIFDVPKGVLPAKLRYNPSGTLRHAEFLLD